MPDDFPNNSSTHGQVIVGGLPTRGTIELQNDEDWFRVTMPRRFYTYVIWVEGHGDLDPVETGTLELFDSQSNLVAQSFSSAPNALPNPIVYQSNDANPLHFIGFTGFDIGDYIITAEILPDDLPETESRDINTDLPHKDPTFAAIEMPGDVDRFVGDFLIGVTYTVGVRGASTGTTTLTDPFLELTLKPLGLPPLVLNDDNSGVGTDAEVDFMNEEPGQTGISTDFELRVWGIDGSTGSYQVEITAEDDYEGNYTTAGRIPMIEGIGAEEGILEFADDKDWFKVDLEAGHWYMLESRNPLLSSPESPNMLMIRNPDGTISQHNPAGDFAYVAQQSGTHHVIARQSLYDFATQYEVTISTTETPLLRASELLRIGTNSTEIGQYFFLDRLDESGFLLGRINRIDTPSKRRNEIVADVPLFYNGVLQTAGTIIHADVNDEVYLKDFTGHGDIFIRQELFTGYYSAWNRLPVTQVQVPEDLKPNNVPAVSQLTFAFANELPSYFENDPRFVDFQELGATLRNAMRTAISYWDQATQLEFAEVSPGATNDAADIMIFSSTTSGYGNGFYPDPGGGYDIVLNRATDIFNDTSEGGQGFYELLRVVGQSLGFRSSSLDRETTIMGVRDTNTNQRPFPSQPLPMDIVALADPYLVSNDVNLGNSTYRFEGNPFFRTIIDSGGVDTIDASAQQKISRLDLRQGKTSYTGAGNSRPHNFAISYYATLENAIGGQYRDIIIGNRASNVLRGNNGHDVLTGNRGNDQLFGGRHSDRYNFRPGDGYDRIDEQGLGGTDIVRITGQHNFDNLAEDLVFERLGNNLRIRLESDGLEYTAADTIVIKNMANVGSRVETLQLRNGDGLFATVSLVSLFDQLGFNQRSRFELGAGQDQFGQLVNIA